jgi:hypothetical protein
VTDSEIVFDQGKQRGKQTPGQKIEEQKKHEDENRTKDEGFGGCTFFFHNAGYGITIIFYFIVEVTMEIPDGKG